MADLQALRLEKLKREKARREAAASTTSPLKAAALGGAKFATFGHDDTAAGLGAGLGAGVQTLLDDGGLSDAWDAAGAARDEARKDRRAATDKAWEDSPVAYGAGGTAGMLLTALLGGGKTVAENATRGAVLGGLGGEGFGDGESVLDDIVNAYVGANLGGAFGIAAPLASQALRPLGTRLTGALGPLMSRGKDALVDAARAGTGAVAKFGEELPDLARAGLAFGTKGASEGVFRGAGGVSKALGSKAPAVRPVSLVDDAIVPLGDEIGAGPVERSGLDLSRPPRQDFSDLFPAAPEPSAPAPTSTPPKAKVNFLAPVDEEVAARSAALDDIAAEAAAAPTPSMKRPAKAWASVGDEEKTAALEAAAHDAMGRFGSPDRAAIQSATGMPSGDLDRLLPAVVRRVRAAGGAVDDVGGNVRRAKETARALPAVDPEGRQANVVRAIDEGSRMKAEFGALQPEQRAAYIDEQLAKGMAPEVLRRRLGLTVAEWRRTSFQRGASK